MKRRLDPDAAVRLYAEGQSTPTIAAQYGVTAAAVLLALRRRGVKLRSISDAVAMAKRGRKHVSHGYVCVSQDKRRRKEHLVIAEAALGRRLKRGECVHHVNGDRADNRPRNLLICSVSYHTELHWRMRRHSYWSQFPLKGNP